MHQPPIVTQLKYHTQSSCILGDIWFFMIHIRDEQPAASIFFFIRPVLNLQITQYNFSEIITFSVLQGYKLMQDINCRIRKKLDLCILK